MDDTEDGTPARFDDSTCQAQSKIPFFSEYLNVNSPLQVGGIYAQPFHSGNYKWNSMPNMTGFSGCIRNLFYNGQLYDLSAPALSENSKRGCPETEQLCSTIDCGVHGSCNADTSDVHCTCDSGWTGHSCLTPTVPARFASHSFVKYSLSFEPSKLWMLIQLMFRTREPNGELFRITNQESKEYAILGIKNHHLQFCYKIIDGSNTERVISLDYVAVDDGQWHTVKVSQYSSTAILKLDVGEGRYYNETNQWNFISIQSDLYAGGFTEAGSKNMIHIFGDFQNGCLDDIRFDGKNLPLPPSVNGTQWAQAVLAQNVERNCLSNISCDEVVCVEPLTCHDIWNKHECNCGSNKVFDADEGLCVEKNDCYEESCLNGGTCVSQYPYSHYQCVCPKDFWGQQCEHMVQEQSVKLSFGALLVVITSFISVLALVIFLVVCKWKQTRKCKVPGPKEDIRENIIIYDDEGGGEDDMTASDVKSRKITEPTLAVVETMEMKTLPAQTSKDVNVLVHKYMKQADEDVECLSFDDLRSYVDEGGNSVTSSLSSIVSGSDDKDQDYNHLYTLGPKFSRLACMYNKEETTEQETVQE